MARSRRDTLIFATILLTPMVVAGVYIAAQPEPEPIVIVREIVTPVVTPVATPVVEAPPAPAPPVVEPTPVEPAPAPVAAPGPSPLVGAGLLMYDHQLVLATAPDLTWSKGKLKTYYGEDGMTASKAVDSARLPEDLRLLADARFVIYAGDGDTCNVTTAPNLLRIHGRQDGDVVYPEEGSDEVTPAQERAALKQVFAEAQLLLARPRPPAGDGPRCDGFWARRADLPAPAVFGRSTNATDLTTEIRAKLGQVPAIRALEAEYEAYRAEREPDGEVGSWLSFRDGTTHVSRWDEIGGARSFVNVVVGDGGEACSDLFSTRVGVLFALENGELVAQPDPGFVDPVALMDLERDGHLEAVTEGAYQLESRGPAGVLQRFDFPFHGCPC